MTYGVIYLITNQINGKQYVGQTIQPIETRFRQHCNNRQYFSLLTHSINKYGKDNFTVEEIDFASNEDELNEKEIYWISKLETLSPNGLNLDGGGLGCIASEETRIKMGNSRRGKKHTKETKVKIGKASKRNWENGVLTGRTGMKHTEETKKLMSMKASGKNNSMYGKSGKLSPTATKVINLDTEEVFDTLLEASQFCGVVPPAISNCCKGKSKTSGGYHWQYYEDYLKEQEETKAS
ncbi:GIY-YIG nuclease family protein [Ruoffia sp. FAM 24228]|uniref:GIY-YIG nuclease family protein n=1 Tax=Ruoffia sp. FAM 24228 TaxID=3259517 RepID=UPI00388B2733